MAQLIPIEVTARTKIEGEWISKSKQLSFPKFDGALSNMIEHLSARGVFERVYDAWMIEQQAKIRAEIEAEYKDGSSSGNGMKTKKSSVLEQLGF